MFFILLLKNGEILVDMLVAVPAMESSARSDPFVEYPMSVPSWVDVREEIFSLVVAVEEARESGTSVACNTRATEADVTSMFFSYP